MKFFWRFIISILSVIFLMILFSLLIFGICSSGKFGVKSMEETSFQSVTYLPQDNTVVFSEVFFNHSVWGHDLMDIWVDLVDIDVNVYIPVMDSLLQLQDVNSLTVSPIWIDRIIATRFVHAKKVIVWVPSEEDKLRWDAWLKKNHTAYLEKEKKNYRRVVPE